MVAVRLAHAADLSPSTVRARVPRGLVGWRWPRTARADRGDRDRRGPQKSLAVDEEPVRRRKTRYEVVIQTLQQPAEATQESDGGEQAMRGARETVSCDPPAQPRDEGDAKRDRGLELNERYQRRDAAERK